MFFPFSRSFLKATWPDIKGYVNEPPNIAHRFIFAIMLLTVSACGGTKLLDIEKTSNALNLSETQHNVVRSKVQQIEEIVEDYELEKETLAAGFAERRNQMRRRR